MMSVFSYTSAGWTEHQSFHPTEKELPTDPAIVTQASTREGKWKGYGGSWWWKTFLPDHPVLRQLMKII